MEILKERSKLLNRLILMWLLEIWDKSKAVSDDLSYTGFKLLSFKVLIS